MQDLLDQLIKIRDKAFIEDVPNVDALKRIKLELFSVNRGGDREKLRPFIEDLKQRLFDSNTRVKGLDFENYFISKTDKEETTPDKPSVKVMVNEEVLEISFDELLRRLLNCLQDTLFNLKGYAIIKLSNNDTQDYQTKVLYDENYYYKPIESRIKKEFDECDSSSIKEYEKTLKDGNIPEYNILGLILLTSKINNNEGFLKTKLALKNIFDSFDNFEFCSLKTIENFNGEFYKRGLDKDDFFEELKYTTSKFLSNGKISFEEEKIIKQIFSTSSAPVLTYKLLKSGNSGAKVIEIKQIQPFTSEQYERRFIVKFCNKDDKRKLRIETQKFTDFIDSYDGFDEYNCSYCESAGHEALLYRYAKSGNADNSYPYAVIIDNIKNPFHNSIENLIEKLFELGLFTHWKSSLTKTETKPKELYSDYLKLGKIENEILKIKNISESEFRGTLFFENLNKLLNFEFATNEKVCHGDLHSENFFIDDTGELFLIDFGYTGINHSLIDHTSLECSIKFNHIPNYIELDALLEIERELLSSDIFDYSYTFKKASSRKDLLKFYNCIKQIRIDSNKYFLNNESKIEYFISLFFMTYRQVGYTDMNQLFALKSSEILLEKIIVDLGI